MSHGMLTFNGVDHGVCACVCVFNWLYFLGQF